MTPLDPERHPALSRVNTRRGSNSKTATYTLLLLVFRGGALWIVVPITVIAWLLTMPVRGVRRLVGRHHPTFRQYLSWADEMLVAVLERTLLRPFGMRNPFPSWPRAGERAKSGTILDAW